MITMFEQYNELDPYGEENWSDKPKIEEGYFCIRMLRDFNINLSHGSYDEDYAEEYTTVLKCDAGDEIYVDIIYVENNYVTITADTGEDYVGVGNIPTDCFEIVN